MKHDDRKMTAALVISVVFMALGVGWCGLANVLKPRGRIDGDSSIVVNRDTHAIYARIDGRMYEALNLTSARLATGNAGQPTEVKASEIEKWPPGPLVGIPGAPSATPINRGAVSAWAVCDTAGAPRSGDKPVVTSIAGPLSRGGRASAVTDGVGVLVTFEGATYVVWDGKRSQVDPADRAVTLSLGLDPGVTVPVELSRSVFDAMPATEPIVVPVVPGAGGPSRWLPGSLVGSVVEVKSAAGDSTFYAVLEDGVQKITSFVADLLRTDKSFGSAAPKVISPDALTGVPQVKTLPVEYYPASRLSFVDTAANPTTCVGWEKGSGDPQARVTVFNGRGLPVSAAMDDRAVPLVRDDRDPNSVVAHRVLVLPGAANFVTATSGVVKADSRESLWWLSERGVLFGVASDEATLKALTLDPGAAVQAPWPILATFPKGPALSQGAARTARDTVTSLGAVQPVNQAKAGG